jgi:hypothetical protein
MPHFELDPATRLGLLCADFTFRHCGIERRDIQTKHILLRPNGDLIVCEGYVWDFGSGPAIDTPEMVAASLAHDALCDLTNSGHLPWHYRRKADTFFRKLLKAYGVPMYRRWYCYAAVRINSLLRGIGRG